MILNLLLDPWPHEADEILRSFPADLFIFNEGFSWPPSSPDFLDTYSGKKGFAKAAIKRGASWVLTIDIEDGPHCDLQERLFCLCNVECLVIFHSRLYARHSPKP